jgi:hypothetical protein
MLFDDDLFEAVRQVAAAGFSSQGHQRFAHARFKIKAQDSS